jgi:hypothetical protein
LGEEVDEVEVWRRWWADCSLAERNRTDVS